MPETHLSQLPFYDYEFNQKMRSLNIKNAYADCRHFTIPFELCLQSNGCYRNIQFGFAECRHSGVSK